MGTDEECGTEEITADMQNVGMVIEGLGHALQAGLLYSVEATLPLRDGDHKVNVVCLGRGNGQDISPVAIIVNDAVVDAMTPPDDMTLVKDEHEETDD